jgi:Arc/MetJ family transcription regulator
MKRPLVNEAYMAGHTAYMAVLLTLFSLKTTIDLDEAKLKRVMKLTGLKTRKDAVDYALTEAERIARIKQVLGRPLYVVAKGEAVVDPDYDLAALREAERPAPRRRRK